jgi:hypothetical protein
MLTANPKSETAAAEFEAIPLKPFCPPTRSLTAAEKAFWKDAFIACAKSTLPGKRLEADQDASICADFADAAMDAYRSRIIWRKP